MESEKNLKQNELRKIFWIESCTLKKWEIGQHDIVIMSLSYKGSLNKNYK